jgi:hypothetical protein
MPWYSVFTGQAPTPRAAPRPPVKSERALVAAAAEVISPTSSLMVKPSAWQNEVWDFYDDLAEFNYGVTWLSNMLSRVRLRAAKIVPGSDEPVFQEEGAGVEILAKLADGAGGQAQLMRMLAIQLSAPGEGYLIGEVLNGVETWQVRSMEEVRAQNEQFEVVEARTPQLRWRALGKNSHVIRVWRPHARYYHLADSPARAARAAMRELELVNRHILAQYLSRLASAGIVIFPEEISFPVREEFQDAEDPFMEEWITIAAEAIKNAGAASAVIPIPMRLPAEIIDKVKHLDFTLKIDDKIIEKRDSAIKRLATKMDMPAEVLLGMGDVNHWGAWQLEEGGLKVHIAPTAELIADSLTRLYMHPRLQAGGEDPAEWVIWYDMSELALQPDRSQASFDAYDRMEVSGAALRRETGFSEEDKPGPQELFEQGLKMIIKTLPSGASDAIAKLTGIDLQPIVPVSPQPPDVAEKTAAGETPDSTPEAQGANAPGAPPGTAEADQEPDGPPDQLAAANARAERMIRQMRTQHALTFSLDGTELLHPKLCAGALYGCPFTHALSARPPDTRPGALGTYACRLDSLGILRIDGPLPYVDPADFLTTGSTHRVPA